MTQHVRVQQNHMNTTFDFVVSPSENRVRHAERCLLQAHALVCKLEDELTEYRKGPIAALNAAKAFSPQPLPESALELLEASERLEATTEKMFSCYVKGTGRVAFSRSQKVAWKTRESSYVSFGAIGKGYALDKVRTLLAQEGFEDFLLSAGGSSVVLSGFAALNEPWTWGWSWGRNECGDPIGLSFKHWSGAPIALGISGTHEKGGHLIHPVTKIPIAERLSALVAHRSAADADAFSTALFISGFDKAIGFSSSIDSPALACVENDGEVRWNGVFERTWGAPV